MSSTDVSPPEPMPSPPPAAARATTPTAPRMRLSNDTWKRVALACALLLGSAGVRVWQTRRLQASLANGRQTPASTSTRFR